MNDDDFSTFRTRFAEAIEGLDPTALGPATDFRALPEWDSLAVLSTIAMADAEYGATLTAKDIRGCADLGELGDLVLARSSA